MPVTKEFTVLMEDRPGTLGKVCRALADRNVNILALHSFPIGGKSVTRFVVDNPTTAKKALDSEQLTCTETEVVQVKLPHRPGEIDLDDFCLCACQLFAVQCFLGCRRIVYD